MTAEADLPTIVDAMIDQHGRRWISVRGAFSPAPVRFAVDELATGGSEIFSRLSKAGVDLLVNRKKDQFRNAVAEHKDYRRGLLASGPGWLGDAFVCSDGKVHSKLPEGSIMVGFDADTRFAASGELSAAQATLGPLITGQTLLLFLVAYSLAPVLFPFAPPDVGNMLVELVGGPECGKTTAGVLAMATWAGDPESNVGGGTTWSRTLLSLNGVKARHNAMMLLLDETNLITEKDKAKTLKDAIFILEATGARERTGDPARCTHSRLAVLSTSNVPLGDIVRGKAEDKKAVATRIMTLLLAGERPHGILDFIPAGYTSAQAAVEALRAVTDCNFAILGPSFAARLAARDPAEAQRAFDSLYAKAMARLSTLAGVSKRNRKTLAMTIVAGQMAARLGVVPKAWGNIEEVVLSLQTMIVADGDAGKGARQAVAEYVTLNARWLRRVEDLEAPMPLSELKRSPGFTQKIDGKLFLLIETSVFARGFGEQSRNILRLLQAAGRTRAEPGKAVMKPPRQLSHEGRMHCIELDHEAPRSKRIVLPKGHLTVVQRQALRKRTKGALS